MKFLPYLILLGVSWSAATASGGCLPLPDVDLSVAQFEEFHGYPWLSLMVVPDGSGDALSEVLAPDGSRVNGEITVIVVDGMGQYVEGVQPDEITLWSADERLVFCPGADYTRAATTAEGMAWFDGPLAAGGTSDGYLRIKICNSPLSASYLGLRINSPDLNGDLEVSLADVPLFAADFHGAYDYRSDFTFDGVVNLADVPHLAAHMGAVCASE